MSLITGTQVICLWCLLGMQFSQCGFSPLLFDVFMCFSPDIHARNPCLQFSWHEKVHFSGRSLRGPCLAPGLSMVHPLTWSLHSLKKSSWTALNPATGMSPSHLIRPDSQEFLPCQGWKYSFLQMQLHSPFAPWSLGDTLGFLSGSLETCSLTWLN